MSVTGDPCSTAVGTLSCLIFNDATTSYSTSRKNIISSRCNMNVDEKRERQRETDKQTERERAKVLPYLTQVRREHSKGISW